MQIWSGYERVDAMNPQSPFTKRTFEALLRKAAQPVFEVLPKHLQESLPEKGLWRYT